MIALFILYSLLPLTSASSLLRKVVILSRHGNRVPNAGILEVCPKFKESMDAFGREAQEGSLTPIGMAEMFQAGAFMRQRYLLNESEPLFSATRSPKNHGKRSILPFRDDGTFEFLAETANRNLMSATAFGMGLFPEGSGPSGYTESRPQALPILATVSGKDDLFNSVGGGRCAKTFRRDIEQTGRLLEKLAARNESISHLLHSIASFCGRAKPLLLNTNKEASLPELVKTLDDALLFAEDEGFHYVVHNLIKEKQKLDYFHSLGFEFLMKWFFDTDRMATYVAGGFPLRLLRALTKDFTKFSYFLAHRELLYAVAKFYEIEINLKGMRRGYLPTGSTFVWELHRDSRNGLEFVKTFIWWPSQSRSSKKKKAEELLSTMGNLQETSFRSCSEVCPLSRVRAAYLSRIEKTGTYSALCSSSSSSRFSSDYAVEPA